MRLSIGVIDYDVGNIGSVINMLRHLGYCAEPVSKPEEISNYKNIILPGVGSFDEGMKKLNGYGFSSALKDRFAVGDGNILGICLGMQMLGDGSEEGALPGLSLIPGLCVKFKAQEMNNLRVPHMGWTNVVFNRLNSSERQDIVEPQRFYFVHSYYFVPNDNLDILGKSVYGIEFASAINRGKVTGVQFHPEKSHSFGKKFFKEYLCEQ